MLEFLSIFSLTVASMITEPPLDTQAYLGETAIFVCVAEAEPTPTFQWNFDGVSITDGDKYDIDTTSTTSRLTVSDITAFDDGTYNCTVENTHGRDSASANLQALCKCSKNVLNCLSLVQVKKLKI